MLSQEGGGPLSTPAEHIRQRGFTLVELLMAIFIFAIVISSVYGAYRSTFRITNSTESQIEYSNMARVALDRITGDLESYYSGTGGFMRGESQEGDTGRSDTLAFTSTSHLIFSKKELPSGYALIAYITEIDDETGLMRLYRIDKAFRPGDTQDRIDEEKGFLLCDRLAEVRFTYFAAEGGSESDDWQSQEAGEQQGEGNTGKYPAMIAITLRFAESAESEKSIVFSTAVATSRLAGTEPP